MRLLILFLTAILVSTLPVMAQETAQRQFEEFVGKNLVDALPSNVEISNDVGNFWSGVQRVFRDAIAKNEGILQTSIKSSAIYLSIILFSAVGCLLTEENGRRAIILIGVTAILAKGLADLKLAVSGGTDAMDEIYTFSLMLLPVIAGACAAAGKMTASAALYSGTALFLQTLISVVKRLLVPLVYASLALASADAALGTDHMKRMRVFLTSIIKNAMRILMLLFGAFMSLTGVLSGNADALALKAAKLAVSTMVPIVGGVVSDATETVLIGAKTVLQSVGLTGMLAILSIIIVPFAKLGLHYLCLQVTSALCSVFGHKEHIAVLDALTTAVGFLTAMTACCAVMAFVACICFIKVSAH